MGKLDKAPRFQTRQLRDGSGFCVLTQWPDRGIERYSGFKSKVEAQRRIEEIARRWINDRFAPTFKGAATFKGADCASEIQTAEIRAAQVA